MKETMKLAITLLVISAVAAAILAFSNDMTKDQIAEIKLQITQEALADIFGDMDEAKGIADQESIIEENPDVKEMFEIIEGGESKGHSLTVFSNGFDGPIEIMVGIDGEGEILGVRLVNHSETAGIGSKAEEPEFTGLFDGQNVEEEIEVQTISGATISSKAVIKGVNLAREIYNEYLID